MEKQDNQKIIDKIKKLLVKHDGCKRIQSEAEAETALNLAFSLMRKHHLDMSMVINEDIDDSNIQIVNRECEKFIDNRLPVWIQNLIQLVNLVCNTQCMLMKRDVAKSAKQLSINFIGERSDVQQCFDMYKFFKTTASRLGHKHQREVSGNFTNWRSFVEGFTTRLLEKAILDDRKVQNQLKKMEQKQSGFESIDDLDDEDELEDTNDVNESSNEGSYELILQQNELVKLNRYKMLVQDKIKQFIKNQKARDEELRQSRTINVNSFKCGTVAANMYNFTKSSKNNLKLEHKQN